MTIQSCKSEVGLVEEYSWISTLDGFCLVAKYALVMVLGVFCAASFICIDDLTKCLGYQSGVCLP